MMDTRNRRQADSSGVPSAKFLQARITALSSTLIKRLENIFAVALDDSSLANPNRDQPPALTDTAVQQLQLDVESTALIRAAEEIMVLTRTMKEIWLFGGLDTIKSDEQRRKEEEMRTKLDLDMRTVEERLQERLRTNKLMLSYERQTKAEIPG